MDLKSGCRTLLLCMHSILCRCPHYISEIPLPSHVAGGRFLKIRLHVAGFLMLSSMNNHISSFSGFTFSLIRIIRLILILAFFQAQDLILKLQQLPSHHLCHFPWLLECLAPSLHLQNQDPLFIFLDWLLNLVTKEKYTGSFLCVWQLTLFIENQINFYLGVFFNREGSNSKLLVINFDMVLSLFFDSPSAAVESAG